LRIDAFPGLSAIEIRDLGGGEWSLQSLVFFYLPGLIGIGCAFGRAVAMQQKPGAVTNLRVGGSRAEAPNRGRQRVSSGVEIGREIVGFESPMGQVASGWTGADGLLIHVQEKLIVGADMHQKVCRFLGKLQHFAKTEQKAIAFGRVSTGNPLGGPWLEVRLDLGGEEVTTEEQQLGE
jgi:hypothetical protein